MALKYTGDELVESARNLVSVANTASTGTKDTDILRHLTEALRSKIVPDIIRKREEYLAITVRIAMSGSETQYRIPSRAIANRLRDIYFYDGSNRRKIDPIPREELHIYESTGTSYPAGYYIQGNYICLVPTVATYSGSLEVGFYFRPGDLVLEASAGQVTVINGSVVTLGNLPSAWSTSDTFDAHSQESGAEIKVWDATVSNVDAVNKQLTFSSNIDGSDFGTKAIAVDDWVCLAGEAVVPAIPKELHPMLVEAACLQIAKGLQDKEAILVHGAEIKNYQKSATSLLDNRVESKPLRITGRKGILWAGKIYN